jgi:hypothetical protein
MSKTDEQKLREKNLRRQEAQIRQENYEPKPPHILGMTIGLMIGDDRSPYSSMVRGLAGIPLDDPQENKQTTEETIETTTQEKPEEKTDENSEQKSE